MATKKAGKKKAGKKPAAKKKSAAKKSTRKADKPKRERKKRVKVPKTPYEANADRISHFMGELIQAGYVGKSIPESGKERKAIAMRIRQMAETLDRQTHKFTAEEL